MAKGDVFHALKHAHRQKTLQTLRRQPRTYSELLAEVDPGGEGSGRFNYHLKVLKDAGLVEVDDALYRTTPSGMTALQLLAQAPEGTSGLLRRRTQLTIVGSLIGVGGISLLLLLSMVLAPVALEAPGTAGDPRWNIPTFVSELDLEAESSPQVAVDSNGNAVALWTQRDGPRIDVWANRFETGVGWGDPTLIEKEDSADVRPPMLAINPGGDAWAVWEQPSQPGPPTPGSLDETYDVWANRFVLDAGWGDAILVATGVTRVDDIALDASGALAIVWHEFKRVGGPDYVEFYADRFVPGIGWTGATALFGNVQAPLLAEDMAYRWVQTSSRLQLAFDAEGRALAVWSAGSPGPWEIHASRYVPNVGWGPPILVGAGEGDDPQPEIAMDSDGRAIVIWIRDPQDVESGLFAARFVPGFGWSEAVLVEDFEQWYVHPQLALDAQGNAIVVWPQYDDDREAATPDLGAWWVDLVTIRFEPDVGWGVPLRIADKVGSVGWPTGYDNFALAMEPGGNAVVLYDDNRSGIYAIRYLPGEGWSDPSRIGTGSALCDPFDMCPPAAAIDPAGNVVAVWQDRKSEPLGLLASRFEGATSLEALARETRDQLERNQMALDAAFVRISTMTVWLALSLSLLVALTVLVGVLFVVYWNPRRGLAVNREIPEDSSRPPGPGGVVSHAFPGRR